MSGKGVISSKRYTFSGNKKQFSEMKIVVFWDAEPCSLVDIDQCFRGTYCLHHHQCNIPEDSHLHTHCHENLKSHQVSGNYHKSDLLIFKRSIQIRHEDEAEMLVLLNYR
jgi:hypothetical protein